MPNFITNNFLDGTPLNAVQVNQNFQDVINATSEGNQIININSAVVNGSVYSAFDIFSTQLTDFSTGSNPTGWSSFSNKMVFYKQTGKTVFVWYYIDGTGSATGASFLLPVNASAFMTADFQYVCPIKNIDNTSVFVSVGILSTGSISIQKDIYSNPFTNGVYRLCQGSFFYEAA
jgi:hypothetical protein